jgi:hypothetical protein
MFLPVTVCNLILSPHPLGRSILDPSPPQRIAGSGFEIVAKWEEKCPGYEVGSLQFPIYVSVLN